MSNSRQTLMGQSKDNPLMSMLNDDHDLQTLRNEQALGMSKQNSKKSSMRPSTKNSGTRRPPKKTKKNSDLNVSHRQKLNLDIRVKGPYSSKQIFTFCNKPNVVSSANIDQIISSCFDTAHH